jgi:hypothetical protein
VGEGEEKERRKTMQGLRRGRSGKSRGVSKGKGAVKGEEKERGEKKDNAGDEIKE